MRFVSRAFAKNLSQCFVLNAFGYQSYLSRYIELERYTAHGLDYNCRTQTAPPPASSSLSISEKLFLNAAYRREASMLLTKRMAILIEGKKQSLQQGIKEIRSISLAFASLYF
jgi:hypothetical protein